MNRWLMCVLPLIAACGCGKQYWTGGDPDFHGAVLVVDSDVDTSVFPDFHNRFAHLLTRSAEFLGRDPQELAGLRIRIVSKRFGCGHTGIEEAVGCYQTDENTITFAMPGGIPDVGPQSFCIERSVVPHELVHYFHGGDTDHQSPEFRLWYFKDLWKELMTYAGGECAVYADVYSGFWAGPAMQP